MPTNFAMPTDLIVSQNLVDAYLARIDRFVTNVNQFEKQLKDLTNAVKDHFTPDITQKTDSYQTITDNQPVVTADDIDIDALLNGVNLDGMSI